MQTIEDRIKVIVSEQLDIHESNIKPESKFLDDLGADSLDMIEMVMAIEDEFGIEIAEGEEEKVSTFRHAVDLVTNHPNRG